MNSTEQGSESGNGKGYVSHRILPTAANLPGLSFVVLSFIKVAGFGLETIIDELVAAAIVMILVACIYSNRSARRSHAHERVADLVFLPGLGLLIVTPLIVILEII